MSTERVDERTNADRIRAMSDEELSYLLQAVYGDGMKDGLGREITGDWAQAGSWTVWLSQPAKEEYPWKTN